MKAVVKSVKTGDCTIELISGVSRKDNIWFGAHSSGPVCYLAVGEDSAEWGKKGRHPLTVKPENGPSTPQKAWR